MTKNFEKLENMIETKLQHFPHLQQHTGYITSIANAIYANNQKNDNELYNISNFVVHWFDNKYKTNDHSVFDYISVDVDLMTPINSNLPSHVVCPIVPTITTYPIYPTYQPYQSYSPYLSYPTYNSYPVHYVSQLYHYMI